MKKYNQKQQCLTIVTALINLTVNTSTNGWMCSVGNFLDVQSNQCGAQHVLVEHPYITRNLANYFTNLWLSCSKITLQNISYTQCVAHPKYSYSFVSPLYLRDSLWLKICVSQQKYTNNLIKYLQNVMHDVLYLKMAVGNLELTN